MKNVVPFRRNNEVRSKGTQITKRKEGGVKEITKLFRIKKKIETNLYYK